MLEAGLHLGKHLACLGDIVLDHHTQIVIFVYVEVETRETETDVVALQFGGIPRGGRLELGHLYAMPDGTACIDRLGYVNGQSVA